MNKFIERLKAELSIKDNDYINFKIRRHLILYIEKLEKENKNFREIIDKANLYKIKLSQ